MKKRSLKIMSVVLAGVMTTGMILGGCSAQAETRKTAETKRRLRN
ncbi:MAG: hypothetical protein ACLR7J_08520 [[Ruminococcus] torques]